MYKKDTAHPVLTQLQSVRYHMGGMSPWQQLHTHIGLVLQVVTVQTFLVNVSYRKIATAADTHTHMYMYACTHTHMNVHSSPPQRLLHRGTQLAPTHPTSRLGEKGQTAGPGKVRRQQTLLMGHGWPASVPCAERASNTVHQF